MSNTFSSLQLSDRFTTRSESVRLGYEDVYLERRGKRLILGNARIRREFDLSVCLLRTKRLQSDGVEFTAPENAQPDFSFIGILLPKERKAGRFCDPVITAEAVEGTWREARHLKVSLLFEDDVQQVTYRRVYVIYPGIPAIAAYTTIRSRVLSNLYWNYRGGIKPRVSSPEYYESRAEGVRLSEGFAPRQLVEFQGRTDYHNDIVCEHDAGELTGRGNLLICGNGSSELLFLQEAPPSRERRDLEDYDFRWEQQTVSSVCWGILPHELSADRELRSYRHVVIACADHRERTALLKQYLAHRFPLDERPCITVNPWGCGNFRQRINEPFLLREIEAAGLLNATHYQVDDGWQAGGPLQSLAVENEWTALSFWDVCRKTLPGGMEKLVEAAEASGVELALWVAPSCNQEYRDWRPFADRLLLFYRQHGIAMFKFDSIRTRTKEAEDHLEAMASYLRNASGGEVYINFDVTNGQRPGYFLMLEYGNIFLENRYVWSGSIAYHPESTLLNLWRLSRYMRPQTLQIEFADPGLVDIAYYEEQGLTLPTVYPPSYWAAITLFASPLAWMAPSLLSNETLKAFREVLTLHRRIQPDLARGEVYPIGDEPNGKGITGFQLVVGERGYVLIFREHQSQQMEAKLRLQPRRSTAPPHYEQLYGSKEDCILAGDEYARVRMNRNATFALWQYS